MKILLLLTLLPTFLFAQATKKVTFKHQDAPYKEVYHVLKKDKKIKHGFYQKFRNPDVLVVTGYYKNGLKDSLWTEYGYTGTTINAQGYYANDQRVGVWVLNDVNGELEQRYDYSKKELLEFRVDDEEKAKQYRVFIGADTLLTQLERPPLFIGGSAKRFEYVAKTIKFPPLARERGISGKVIISFTVDSTGKASNHKVSQGIGGGCDEEALRVIKSLPDEWIPALLNGQPVSVEHALPIGFSLR